MVRRMSFLALLLVVVVSAAPSYGGDVYLYDNAVKDDVDIGHFTSTGEVAFLRGISKFSDAARGPAPEPYPQIHLWEPGYETMGASNVEMDGVWFINLGPHWSKNKLALVLWKIRVPNASTRTVSEFEEDLTLSMWVDWDENRTWDKDELMIRNHINLAHCLPTDDETITVYYLTGFRVPDVGELTGADSWWLHWKKEIVDYWVRGTIAYDDPDVSPDGEQLFGEIEDYRVSYMLITKKKEMSGE